MAEYKHTPIRRISHGSLAYLSVSRGQTRSSTDQPLSHLTSALVELSDGFADLAASFEQLDIINENLNGFNEAFASFIYGLRANAYTAEFLEAPTEFNFTRAEKRASKARNAAQLAAQAAAQAEQAELSPKADDTTFIEEPTLRSESSIPSRGRGTAMRGRGTVASKAAAAKRKDKLLQFASSIITTLPIQYREQQPHRSEVESVIMALRANPNGLHMTELVDKIPKVPKHRINDSLLALIRAKHVLKLNQKGLLYRLDPERHPA